MHLKILLLALPFVSVLTSCDCYFRISGVVMDQSTNMPVSDVIVSRNEIDLHAIDPTATRTGHAGTYEFSGVSGNCNKIRLHYYKPRYQAVEQNNKTGMNDTVWLQPAAIPAIDPVQLVGTWELRKRVSNAGHIREKSGEYIEFKADGTCGAGKIGGDLRQTGTWKFDPETAEVIISIQETEKEDGAFILSLTAEELIVSDSSGISYLYRLKE